MSTRRDHYYDPDAPAANTIRAGGSAIVTDEQGRVLLQRRTDSGNWALPGGVMDIGETLEECVIREVKEETGLDIEITSLVGIYTDPHHVIAYADGEVRQQFNITFTGRVTGGQIIVSEESTQVDFIALDELEELPIHPTSDFGYGTTPSGGRNRTLDSRPGARRKPLDSKGGQR